MPGPAPKPYGQRRHRNATPGFTQIDPSPREEDAPEWPLQPNAVPEFERLESERWDELWRLPQAREWERMRCFNMVALYTRLEVLCTTSMPDPRTISELRQLDMSLGITPKAMLGLRWEIPQAQSDEDRPAATLHSVDRRAYVPAAG